MASSSSSLVISSPRWCPTQEQVMILEEIYNRGGIKTPNAFQIQQITVHLSFYGKIEGKNVFYWFQNHKARERQKLRRKLMQNQKQLQLISSLHQPHWCHHHSLPSAALQSLHQGGRGEAAGGLQDDRTAVRPEPNGIQAWVQPLLADKLISPQPQCHITPQRPLKTLDLFPLKSTHLNLNVNPNDKDPASSSSN